MKTPPDIDTRSARRSHARVTETVLCAISDRHVMVLWPSVSPDWLPALSAIFALSKRRESPSEWKEPRLCQTLAQKRLQPHFRAAALPEATIARPCWTYRAPWNCCIRQRFIYSTFPRSGRGSRAEVPPFRRHHGTVLYAGNHGRWSRVIRLRQRRRFRCLSGAGDDAGPCPGSPEREVSPSAGVEVREPALPKSA